ncbi:MAG: translation initiation factor IF-3 [Bacteriovoracaceae bacterium]|nr:translation initiation factor IF-3 [Bacteriovoracaceae bacterium]
MLCEEVFIKEKGPRVNHEIRISECRLIGDDGTQYGILSMTEAHRLAQETGLDLVEISPAAKPPVVKLINYGKYKYQLQKKSTEAKKKQVVVQLKEIQFRPNIEAHDVETKLNKIKEFLEDGNKVKMLMQFRGRELAYLNAGMEKFKAIMSKVEAFGAAVEAPPKTLGNRIITIMAPVTKKTSGNPAKAKEANPPKETTEKK